MTQEYDDEDDENEGGTNQNKNDDKKKKKRKRKRKNNKQQAHQQDNANISPSKGGADDPVKTGIGMKMTNEERNELFGDSDQSEDEGIQDYKIGGYHPIHVGEVMIDRYLVV